MTGDQSDIFSRLKKLLPGGWFGQAATPVLDALLQAPAWTLSLIYSLWAYAKLQTRIQTASDGFLDLIAQDFFNGRVTRRANQSDSAFRAVILANLFPERNTRAAIVKVLTALTGRPPQLVEPWNSGDTGVLDGPGLYFDCAGALGAPVSELPYQGFVQAYRPLSSANADLAGWDVPTGGWNAGRLYFADTQIGTVTDADIIAAVESVRMANTVIWLNIADNPPTIPPIVAQFDFSDPNNSGLIGIL